MSITPFFVMMPPRQRTIASATEAAKAVVDMKTLRTDESLLLFLLQREKIHTSAVLVRDIPRPAENGKEKTK